MWSAKRVKHSVKRSGKRRAKVNDTWVVTQSIEGRSNLSHFNSEQPPEPPINSNVVSLNNHATNPVPLDFDNTHQIFSNPSLTNNTSNPSINLDGPDPLAEPKTKYTSLKIATQLIPKYDGTNMPLNEFLDDCKSGHDSIHPNERELFVKFVKSKIEGDAKSHIRSCSYPLTLKSIEEALKRAYGPRKTVEALQSEMSQMRQLGKQESVLKFFGRINEKLVEIVQQIKAETGSNPSTTYYINRAQKHAVGCFSVGLWPKIGSQVISKDPETLKEAIEIALKAEDVLKRQTFLYPPRDFRNSDNSFNNFNSNLNMPQRGNTFQRPTEVNVNVAKSSQNEPTEVSVNMAKFLQNSNNRKKCYNCDSTSHLKAQCPNGIRCSACSKTGHVEKYCYSKYGKAKVLELKQREQAEKMGHQILNGTGASRKDATRSTVPIIELPPQSPASIITST